MGNNEQISELIKKRNSFRYGSSEYMRLSKQISRLRNPERSKKQNRKRAEKLQESMRGFSVKNKIFFLHIFYQDGDTPHTTYSGLSHQELIKLIQNIEKETYGKLRDRTIIRNLVRTFFFGNRNLLYGKYKISFIEKGEG